MLSTLTVMMMMMMMMMLMMLQCFTAMVHDSDGHDVITMGCIEDSQRAQLNCHVGSQTYVAIKCCNNVSFCNRRLIPRYVTDNSASAHHHHLDSDNDGATAAGKLRDIDTCSSLLSYLWPLLYQKDSLVTMSRKHFKCQLTWSFFFSLFSTEFSKLICPIITTVIVHHSYSFPL